MKDVDVEKNENCVSLQLFFRSLGSNERESWQKNHKGMEKKDTTLKFEDIVKYEYSTRKSS